MGEGATAVHGWGEVGMGRSSSYHTNTTGGHICGYHDGTLAGFELVQDPVTFILLFVTMDGCREKLSQ
jgi:hypothetical protein